MTMLGIGRLKYPRFAGAILHACLDYPRLTVMLCVLFTLFFAVQLAFLETNPTTYLLDKSHPARVVDSEMDDLFTATGASISVVVAPASGTIYQADTLRLVEQLTQAFEQLNLSTPADIETLRALPGDASVRKKVDAILEDGLRANDRQAIEDLRAYLPTSSAGLSSKNAAFLAELAIAVDPVRRVKSLTNVEDLQDEDDLLETVVLLENLPQSPAEFRQLQQRIQDNPLLLGSFVAEDEKATGIQIELNAPHDDAAIVSRANHVVLDIVDQASTDHRISVGGTTVITNTLSYYIKQDNDRFFPLVLLVIVVVLALSFRTLEGIYIPLTIAIASLICTLGLLPLLGIQQNMITTMIPIFVMAVSVADGIHFLNEFYKIYARNGQQLREAILTTYNVLFRPLSYTAFTTVLGFVSLAFTDISFVRDFGIFVAIGVFYAYVFTMVLVPAMIMLRTRRKAMLSERERDSLLMRMISRFAVFLSIAVLQYRRWVIVTLVFALLVSVYYAQHVRAGYEGIAMYPEESRLRHDDSAIKEHFRGVVALSIRIDGTESGSLYQDEVIRYIDEVETTLKAHPNVGYVLSPNSYVKRINQILNDGERDTLPADMNSALAAQLYLLYDNSAGQDIRDVVDVGYRHGRIVVMLDTDRTGVIRDVVDTLQQVPVPASIATSLAGYGGVALAATEEIVYGQLSSLFSSFLFILVIMTFLFRHLGIGLITVLPLVFTLAINFCVMGFFDLQLDVATSLIAAIVFGVGDDYCIHFMEMYKEYLELGHSRQQALALTIQHVSQPLVVNSLSLAGGFLVLCVSSFQPLTRLGMLMGLTMLVAALATLIIQPVLLSLFRIKALDALAQQAHAIKQHQPAQQNKNTVVGS